MMENFEEYEIQFTGLKNGEHEYKYHIDEAFFALFNYKEFSGVDVDVSLLLEKQTNVMELTLQVKGTVNVICDVSLVAYDQPIEGVLNLEVKFGEAFDDEDDEYLILPYDAHTLEIQQYIYESVILAVPYKKVHPKVKDGTMKSVIIEKLKELSPGNKKAKKETDPRWDKLKKLLNDK